MTYQPPFTLSARAVTLVAEISAQIERYVIRLEQRDALRLRRASRIRTIHSSLAIEGNTLSLKQVTDILDGKRVMAPPRDMQEVRNAIATYELATTLNPYSIEELLRAHGCMMAELMESAGAFRTGEVGVLTGEQVIHIAPPAGLVPQLIADLFDWLRTSREHLLLRSCVFHYEFEFIHPFADGNGRIGRLWQSLILSKLHPLFLHLPVETMVHDNQKGYYQAIRDSTDQANAGMFVDFMLERILEALEQHQVARSGGVNGRVNGGVNGGVSAQERVYDYIRRHPGLRASALALALCLPKRTLERHVGQLRRNGRIEFRGAPKNGGYFCRESPQKAQKGSN